MMKMKGWATLACDVNWEDYGGMWAKEDKAKPGTWIVLRFTNLYDAMGERDCKRDGIPQFECDVKLVDLKDIEAKIAEALRSCGYVRKDENTIVNEHDGSPVVSGPDATLCIVEACVGYGLGAPLESFTSEHRPVNLRARARKYAEEMIRPAGSTSLRDRLARPVNAIGTSARDYGRGVL